jgi:hypothetical protein
VVDALAAFGLALQSDAKNPAPMAARKTLSTLTTMMWNTAHLLPTEQREHVRHSACHRDRASH